MWKWQEYVALFQRGDVFTRAQMARAFGVDKSTAKNHLEKAVRHGALKRAWFVSNGGATIGYALPETVSMLPGTQYFAESAS